VAPGGPCVRAWAGPHLGERGQEPVRPSGAWQLALRKLEFWRTDSKGWGIMILRHGGYFAEQPAWARGWE
jgi:hypothetical protein